MSKLPSRITRFYHFEQHIWARVMQAKYLFGRCRRRDSIVFAYHPTVEPWQPTAPSFLAPDMVQLALTCHLFLCIGIWSGKMVGKECSTPGFMSTERSKIVA